MFVGVVAMVSALAAYSSRQREVEAIARRALTSQLLELATHDGLTGCLNHRTFYEEVAAEIARAARYGHRLSLLLADVDDFKRVNDVLGHVAGDAALQAVAAVLRAGARSTDTIGRIGGDEFAVVLVPEATHAQAAELARRIERAVADASFRPALTVSIGIAEMDRPEPSCTPQVLVSEADAALYRMKRAHQQRA